MQIKIRSLRHKALFLNAEYSELLKSSQYPPTPTGQITIPIFMKTEPCKANYLMDMLLLEKEWVLGGGVGSTDIGHSKHFEGNMYAYSDWAL